MKTSSNIISVFLLLTICITRSVMGAPQVITIDASGSGTATKNAAVGDTIQFQCKAVSGAAGAFVPTACLMDSGSNFGYYPFPALDSNAKFSYADRGASNSSLITLASGSAVPQAPDANTLGESGVATLKEDAEGAYFTCGCRPDGGAATIVGMEFYVPETKCKAFAQVCGTNKEQCEALDCKGDNIDCSITSGGFGSGILHAPLKLASILTVFISVVWLTIG